MIKTNCAKDVKVGDTILFYTGSLQFVVEEIESTEIGMIIFRDGFLYQTYWPLETVLVNDSDPKPEDCEDVGTYGVW